MPTQADDRMLRVMLRYDEPDSFQQFVADMGRRPEGKNARSARREWPLLATEL